MNTYGAKARDDNPLETIPLHWLSAKQHRHAKLLIGLPIYALNYMTMQIWLSDLLRDSMHMRHRDYETISRLT